jgi:hypothetical protein
MRAELRDALVKLHAHRNPDSNDHIIHSERDAGMSAGAVQVWFHRLIRNLDLVVQARIPDGVHSSPA